jgi:hypothetical protein
MAQAIDHGKNASRKCERSLSFVISGVFGDFWAQAAQTFDGIRIYRGTSDRVLSSWKDATKSERKENASNKQ